jgi:Calcineurin-like phosphoesterase
MVKSSFLWIACLLSVWVGSAQGGPKSPLQVFARAPYLQLATPHSIWVVWRTDGLKPLEIRYGLDVRRLDSKVPAQRIVVRVSLGTNAHTANLKLQVLRQPRYARLPRLHSAPAGLVQYEAMVSGLRPNTRYYYGIFEGDARLTPEDRSYSFVTHPMPGQAKSTRFWVVGDSGVGREPQTSVHRTMVDLTTRQGRPLDFFVHVGDMAYPKGRDVEFQTRFFDMYEPTLRQTVCWPAMGNHEGITSRGTNGVGPYYDAYVLPTRGEAGGVPSGTEAYYAFDYGRIHFVCLDSHDLDRKPTGAMARWLKADLERARSDWLIAFWHHPPYTKGSHDSDKEKQLLEMRTHIMPILESAGVDLVLTGHSHIYERSMLMDGAYATPTVAENVILDDGDGDPRGDGAYRKSAGLNPNQGEIQIVAGHGGARLGRKGTMPVMKRVVVEHGSVLIDVEGITLTGIMRNKDGVERDRFSLVKQGTATPIRLAHPRQLPPYAPPASPSDDGAEEPPADFIVLIEQHDLWQYLAGTRPVSPNWTGPAFVPAGWRSSRADFGYGDERRHQTELSDMKNRYTTVYLRHEFEVENADYVSELGLMIDYDDAFVAYLNGREVLRKGVRKEQGSNALTIKAHESNGYRYYPIKDIEKRLRTGRNVLAIEGHNVNADSSDFLMDPYLIMED